MKVSRSAGINEETKVAGMNGDQPMPKFLLNVIMKQISHLDSNSTLLDKINAPDLLIYSSLSGPKPL